MNRFDLTGVKVYRAGDVEPDLPHGTVAVVNYGDYASQEVWMKSGVMDGSWICLGGDGGQRPPIRDDPRTYAQKLVDPRPYIPPAGALPSWPKWTDMLRRGPVVILAPGQHALYEAGWRNGRRDLLSEIESLAEDGPNPTDLLLLEQTQETQP